MKKHLVQIIPSFIIMMILLFLWESFVRFTHISSDILPSPSLIFSAMFMNWNVLLQNTLQTLLETILGIIVAIILGIGIAIMVDFSPLLRRAIYPLLITSQTIPMIALAPLLLIWLGFDLFPKVIIVTLYCFFPLAIATADGFAHVDRELIDLVDSMNASYWQKMMLIKFPSALPSFFSGLKIAVTYSMTGAMVGEFVGAYLGLGIFIQTAANAHAISLVFAAIFITACISIFLFLLVGIIENLLLPWYTIQKKNL